MFSGPPAPLYFLSIVDNMSIDFFYFYAKSFDMVLAFLISTSCSGDDCLNQAFIAIICWCSGVVRCSDIVVELSIECGRAVVVRCWWKTGDEL